MTALIASVLGLQLAGELLARWLGLPVPGPVIGMLLLFTALSIRGETPANLSKLANTVLGHLSLLFVPAGVGIISYLGLIAEQWLAIMSTLIVSTLIAIAVTAFILRWLKRPDPADAKSASERSS
ncbi:MAG: CidA/LrgA family protein [Spiribacter sp.]|jgi:holin-like protein|nr:CidA/LrgA family protein [Spiribacter sp.]MDR9489423.1 CidA/LrgA family protein [Spiribacter sp.]